MDVSRSEPPAVDPRPPMFGSLALFLGGLVLYIMVWELLDPPPTWNRCAPPSSSELAELSARRNNFLLVAVPLVTVYAIWLASRAWTWAADRRARQGHERRPGRIAHGATVVLGSVWLLLVGSAFIGDEVGGATFWGFLLAAAGAVVSAALVIGVLAGAFHSPTRSRSEDVIDSLSVGLLWSILFCGVPVFFIGIAIAGKDATLWC